MSQNCTESIVECRSCNGWVEVPRDTKIVDCNCGERYVVTVSKL